MDATTGAGLAAGNGPDKVWTGGKTAFIVESTFGGGSVKLQQKLPQGNYVDIASASLTAAGQYITDLAPGTYRAVSTTATSTYAKLVSIPQS